MKKRNLLRMRRAKRVKRPQVKEKIQPHQKEMNLIKKRNLQVKTVKRPKKRKKIKKGKRRVAHNRAVIIKQLQQNKINY